MKYVLFTLLFSLAALSVVSGQNRNLSIKNIQVVDVEKGTLITNQTVNIKNGIITEIGPSGKVKIDKGTVVIDGHGKYLAPGYFDMHVHTFDKKEFSMFLINGITSVRNLHGINLHLAWRDSLQRDLLIGPNIFTAGPILDGNPPTRRTNKVMFTRKQARDTVRWQKKAGYDFIKLYDNVPDSIYQEILEAAAENSMPVVGHVPTPIGIEKLIEYGGQHCIEHIEELVPFFKDRADTAYMYKIAKSLRDKNIWLDPTLTVYQWPLREREMLEQMLSRPGMKFMNPETLQMWNWTIDISKAPPKRDLTMMKERLNFANRILLPILYKSGVKMMIGTDSPMQTIIPGYSFHEEIEQWSLAGISPVDILRACTINPATYLKIINKTGTVSVGKIADLVLLTENPLSDAKNLNTIESVIKNGNVHSTKSLLDSLKSR
jgi:imidazolonepropionase-like amidohydrolase